MKAGLAGYRVVTTAGAFECTGKFERIAETYVLRLFVITAEARLIEADIRKERSVEVVAIAGGEPIMAARIRQVKARGSGAFLEVACLLWGPEQ